MKRKDLVPPYPLPCNKDLKKRTILNMKRQNAADAEINIFLEFLITHFWLTCSETNILVKGSVYSCLRLRMDPSIAWGLSTSILSPKSALWAFLQSLYSIKDKS